MTLNTAEAAFTGVLFFQIEIADVYLMDPNITLAELPDRVLPMLALLFPLSAVFPNVISPVGRTPVTPTTGVTAGTAFACAIAGVKNFVG
jgi:hypothetical protein